VARSGSTINESKLSIPYLLVDGERRRVELFRRDGDVWLHTVYEGSDVAQLPAISCVLSVRELYDLAGVA